MISLFPNNPSIAVPTQVERSQAFSISSYLQFNCFTSLSNTKQWIIETCTTHCFVEEQYSQQLTTTTLREVYIPAKILQYGIYRMTMTVTMNISPQLISSAVTYVMIIPSAIIVNLIQFGTSMITQGQQQILTLDPGTFSIDPDADQLNSSVSVLSKYNYDFSLVFFRIGSITTPVEFTVSLTL